MEKNILDKKIKKLAQSWKHTFLLKYLNPLKHGETALYALTYFFHAQSFVHWVISIIHKKILWMNQGRSDLVLMGAMINVYMFVIKYWDIISVLSTFSAIWY